MKTGTLKVNILAKTGGNGCWSHRKASVRINRLGVKNVWLTGKNGNRLCGELMAFFPAGAWSTEKHGLIYTDRLWLKQFRQQLVEIGFSKRAAAAVDYSEQGMQGDNYVSLDAGDQFIREFAVKMTFGELEFF